MRWFVQQSKKGGGLCDFIQYLKSKLCDDILKIISEELNVKRNNYDNIDAYLESENNYLKNFEKEYESKTNDSREEDIKDKESHINEKLSQHPNHQLKNK